ncbi:MAG: hypothetical protein HS105_07685 [Chloracidobacterium sp.]|nr:hypothetical protein [Chloracidobacterium sp.]MCC6824378.1 hypothetical protein [Acidobacteriota bacterium]MCO5332649.1 hypothetical protein [Pyrinomonadaceae bacterium]
MKVIYIVVITLVLSIAAAAQTGKFKWEDELCVHTGTYNSKSYTKTQLSDTQRLVKGELSAIFASAMVFKYADIASIDVAAIDAEYRQKSETLKALKLVPGKYWEELRQSEIRALEERYRLERATALGYSDPKVLLKYEGADACKAAYVEPLIKGGDAMINAWRKLNLEQQKKNADPKRLEQEFRTQSTSPDKGNYALVELVTFGWTNCANDLTHSVDAVSDGTAAGRFRKLFTKVTSRCDEP